MLYNPYWVHLTPSIFDVPSLRGGTTKQSIFQIFLDCFGQSPRNDVCDNLKFTHCYILWFSK
jgi:hypothetical protein